MGPGDRELVSIVLWNHKRFYRFFPYSMDLVVSPVSRHFPYSMDFGLAWASIVKYEIVKIPQTNEETDKEKVKVGPAGTRII